MISRIVDAVAVSILVLGTAVWLGGFVTIVVVTRVARHTLEPSQAVVFFRGLGRTYGIVATVALALALAGGGTLVRDHSWDARLAATTALGAALLAATGLGVAQARAMTRLRRLSLTMPDDAGLARRVARHARRAVVLRSLIGGLTVALVTLGVLLAA